MADGSEETAILVVLDQRRCCCCLCVLVQRAESDSDSLRDFSSSRDTWLARLAEDLPTTRVKRSMTTGLVLGKFAPLHRGHQFLIETALSENEKVVAIIYNATDVTSISLDTRANWIRQLYPTIEVLEAWDGPTVVGDTPEIKRLHEEYIRKILAGRKIDAFYSSEFYGEHVSQSLHALDRRLDESRERFPISGTLLRAEPYRYRQFVDPLVYRDLITKVVFLGAPSTGKTTLARELAHRRQTVWMPEYGREYWETHQENRRLSLDQ